MTEGAIAFLGSFEMRKNSSDKKPILQYCEVVTSDSARDDVQIVKRHAEQGRKSRNYELTPHLPFDDWTRYSAKVGKRAQPARLPS